MKTHLFGTDRTFARNAGRHWTNRWDYHCHIPQDANHIEPETVSCADVGQQLVKELARIRMVRLLVLPPVPLLAPVDKNSRGSKTTRDG